VDIRRSARFVRESSLQTMINAVKCLRRF
jgi:hypothetical protein